MIRGRYASALHGMIPSISIDFHLFPAFGIPLRDSPKFILAPPSKSYIIILDFSIVNRMAVFHDL